MPNSIHTPAIAAQPTAPARQYDAGDLLDAYSLAEDQLSTLSMLIGQAKKELIVVTESAQKYGMHDCYFYTIKKLLMLAEYLADDNAQDAQQQAEIYEKEWQAEPAKQGEAA